MQTEDEGRRRAEKRRRKKLAEVGVVEVYGDGVAFGGSDLDGGGVGGEGFGGEVECEGGTGEGALTTFAAKVVGVAVISGGDEFLIAVVDAGFEVSPEVLGAGD